MKCWRVELTRVDEQGVRDGIPGSREGAERVGSRLARLALLPFGLPSCSLVPTRPARSVRSAVLRAAQWSGCYTIISSASTHHASAWPCSPGTYYHAETETQGTTRPTSTHTSHGSWHTHTNTLHRNRQLKKGGHKQAAASAPAWIKRRRRSPSLCNHARSWR